MFRLSFVDTLIRQALKA